MEVTTYFIIYFEQHTTLANAMIEKDIFGSIVLPKVGKRDIDQYTLKNNFMSVEIINYGSIVKSIKIPDSQNVVSDIVLGFDSVDGYFNENTPYLGATIGRVANRITNGTFKIGETIYNVTRNVGPHTLHGGKFGFDKKIWSSYIDSDSVVMTYQSNDLEEGFPGDVFVEIRYTLTSDNELVIAFKATSNKATPVNIVNHSYFNLGGHEKGAEGLYEHEIKINADRYTPLNEELLPTGEIKSVDMSEYDLRNIKNLGEAIKNTIGNGFDINYVVNGEGFREVAEVIHPKSGRYMKVLSDQPGVQFYTSNSLSNVKGKDGVVYNKHGALCLETQQFPDAVNHETFPSSVLASGELYTHTLCFKFGVNEMKNKTV